MVEAVSDALATGKEADQAIVATEFLVWDRERQGWVRVVLVWSRTVANPRPAKAGLEEEVMPDPEAGASFSEPGSLDEELWFWDRMFERWDQEPAGDEGASKGGRQRPECLTAAA